MKKLFIILIALSLAACKKDCTTCTGTVTGEDGYYDEVIYSQQEDGDCDLNESEYQSNSHEEIELYARLLEIQSITFDFDPVTGAVTIDSTLFYSDLVCD